ncbi:type II toxin-antitoxin system prevent-host-death family antitoxin [Euzebya pacifica]|jgi:prevent-host-death family protein|uniref:type II toxin-antitoxin system Phd/YefM family antitoxin n=1 Tax=Euzebya pacifica TaxID=1608957 RepID=UPI0030FAC5EF
MADVTATEAARHFANLLDAVERGEDFTIIRRGRAVAHLEPVQPRRGASIKQVLREQPPDRQWRQDVADARELLTVEERT